MTRYSVKIPASGALKGRLLAKKEEKGSISSLPSSWITVRDDSQAKKDNRS